jgi:hypothetical protein
MLCSRIYQARTLAIEGRVTKASHFEADYRKKRDKRLLSALSRRETKLADATRSSRFPQSGKENNSNRKGGQALHPGRSIASSKSSGIK